MMRNSFIALFILFIGFELSAQLAPSPLDITVRKSGPYVGVQRGLFTVVEIGGEMQLKQVKLKTTVTHGVHTGFNYDFKYNVLGYDLGYFIKPTRIGLTYGANAVFRTDFNVQRIGIAPVLGYKLFGFHLQTGYNFLTPSSTFINTNDFFISLRFVLINNKKIDVDRKKRSERSESK